MYDTTQKRGIHGELQDASLNPFSDTYNGPTATGIPADFLQMDKRVDAGLASKPGIEDPNTKNPFLD